MAEVEVHNCAIWPTHEWLCGADPDSFHLPPLTSEEMDRLEAIKDEAPPHSDESYRITSQMCCLVSSWEEIRRRLTAPAPARRPTSAHADSRDLLLMLARGHIMQWPPYRDHIAPGKPLGHIVSALVTNAVSDFGEAFGPPRTDFVDEVSFTEDGAVVVCKRR